MPRKKKYHNTESNYIQLEMDFDQVINSAQVLSRDQVVYYDPVQRTTDYMKQLVKAQKEWETTIQTAREQLLNKDARELYIEFFIDLKQQIEQNSPQSERLAKLLRQVAIRGLGMTSEQVDINSPPRGNSKWKVTLNQSLIEQHLSTHIIGKNFLNPIESDDTLWNNANFLIGSSDVSQHRSSVPTPARFFQR
jgi:hypothetical protein